MSVDPKDLAPTLAAVGDAATAAGALLSGAAKTTALIVGAALRFAASIAAAGKDPLQRIERLHAAEALLGGVEDVWQREVRRRWPGDGR